MSQLYILLTPSGWPDALVEETRQTPKRIYIKVLDTRDESKWTWLRCPNLSERDRHAHRSLERHDLALPVGRRVSGSKPDQFVNKSTEALVAIDDPDVWYKTVADVRSMHARHADNQHVLDREFRTIEKAHFDHKRTVTKKAVTDIWAWINSGNWA